MRKIINKNKEVSKAEKLFFFNKIFVTVIKLFEKNNFLKISDGKFFSNN
jgi:hypothetical protein